MHRGRSSLTAAGELRPKCISPAAQCPRGVWANYLRPNPRLGRWTCNFLQLGRSVQRDSARFTQWVDRTHQLTRSCHNLAEQGAIQTSSPLTRAFPPRGFAQAASSRAHRPGKQPHTLQALLGFTFLGRACLGPDLALLLSRDTQARTQLTRLSEGLGLPAKHGQNFGSTSPLALHLHPFSAGFSANSS